MILKTFILAHDTARAGCSQYAQQAPVGTVVEFKERKRSLDQNDKLHPMVRDIARVVLWPINGTPARMSEPQWRHFFAAHIRKGAQLVPNLDGDGFIALGVGTSELTARECSEMIELMYAFGSERGVAWSEKSREHHARYGLRERA